MPLITGPYHVVVGLLLVAGVAKLARPKATAEVAGAAGLPAASGIVRAFALAEVVAAVVALVFGGALVAAVVAVLYGVFAVFVITLVVRGIETAGCGCFGQESEEPPGARHITVDVAAALIAGLAAVRSVPDLLTVLSAQPLYGIPYLAFAVLGIWLMVVVLTGMPRLAHPAGEVSP